MNKKNYNTLHYVIALLKNFNIKHIVASPGAQNATFNRFLQNVPYFSCHSVVDERSAGYVALGIARESDEPVVLTCTGATASRNYMSALTEAYYSNVPLIAITFFPYTNTKFNLSPQFVDRSNSPNDIKALSIELPLIKTKEDIKKCLVLLNAALTTAKYKKLPVHINCPTIADYDMAYELPDDFWHTEYIKDHQYENMKKKLLRKKVCIFIGEHSFFNNEEEVAISNFAKSWNAPVFCDHTSHYNGENKVLISQIANMKRLHLTPDIIIDIGRICGDYSYPAIFKKAEIWRISENGDFSCRLSLPVKYIFESKEQDFFNNMCNNSDNDIAYYCQIRDILKDIKIPEMPLCNPFIAFTISKFLPENATLHLSILNSLRSMNLFDIKKTIKISSNVGGFGIDGALSTIVGHSLASPEKMHFGIVGDLAFFYDMNALGLREIKNNVRIILVNNNRGEEFRLIENMENAFGNTSDNLIAAAGHYKNGAKGWVESCGFKYISARTKEEFLENIEYFCNSKCNEPIIFEIFTKNEDEQNGLKKLKAYNRNEFEESAISLYKTIKGYIS